MGVIPCRSCGKEFDPIEKRKVIRAGFYNQCAACSARSMDINIKYLGRPGATNKGADIHIFRTDLVNVRGILKRESAIGRNANINLSSAVNASKKTNELDVPDLTRTRAICHPPTTCSECTRKLDCLGTPWLNKEKQI